MDVVQLLGLWRQRRRESKKPGFIATHFIQAENHIPSFNSPRQHFPNPISLFCDSWKAAGGFSQLHAESNSPLSLLLPPRLLQHLLFGHHRFNSSYIIKLVVVLDTENKWIDYFGKKKKKGSIHSYIIVTILGMIPVFKQNYRMLKLKRNQDSC